jgi:hypothetical protein
VVRVPRRVFQRLLPERPTPERCVEAYYLPRTRFEGLAERKLRRELARREREMSRRDCAEAGRDYAPNSRGVSQTAAHSDPAKAANSPRSGG